MNQKNRTLSRVLSLYETFEWQTRFGNLHEIPLCFSCYQQSQVQTRYCRQRSCWLWNRYRQALKRNDPLRYSPGHWSIYSQRNKPLLSYLSWRKEQLQTSISRFVQRIHGSTHRTPPDLWGVQFSENAWDMQVQAEYKSTGVIMSFRSDHKPTHQTMASYKNNYT